ncbi:MAG TPA: amidohydrolase family protein [bacterium]|nr:amidohydrolase family protein [bacterium]HOL34637.1 amidohydrolase family protein [bacterium]HPP08183.1 amidohydrolase family protein [bacterium]
MANYPVINIHGHLHKKKDLCEMVNNMVQDGVIKFCALALGRQWQEKGYYGNEDVLKAMKKYPDIIVGMGHIEIGGPYFDKPEKVDRLKELGFSGLKFISPDAPYGHEKFYPFYERAEKLNMPIIFHVGIVSVGPTDRLYGVNSEFMRPFSLDPVCRYFPDLKVILAHPGEPYHNESLTLIEFHKNAFLCLSGGSGSDFHINKIIKLFSGINGANKKNPDENFALFYFKKTVFGTDNPPASLWIKQSNKILDYFEIDNETRKLYYWKNAASIFGWEI